MDETLRCNSLPCRKALQPEGRAVSTTCSHIFCYDCATTLLKGRRICPACNTALDSPDDAIVTLLNPSASYKASILAGLSPHVIMEICTRAIAFHHYQVTQEAAFQHILLRKAQEAVAVYEREMERVELSAKTEMRHLDSKIADLQHQLDNERRKSREMHDMLRTSGRDYEKLKMQFDQSKRNAVRNDIARSTPVANAVDASPIRVLSSSTSAPQSFFAAHDAITSTGRAFYSPRPLSSQRVTADPVPLWSTPSRNKRESFGSATNDGRGALHDAQHAMRSPAPPSYVNGRLSVAPPAYGATPSRMHSRAPNADHRHVQSPIRAMPLPPHERRTSLRPDGTSKVVERGDGGTQVDRVGHRGQR